MSATNYMSELPFAHLDEDSFQTLMYELEHGLINYNFENLVNLSFNPFANTVNHNFALTSGLDPDTNLYSANTDRSYYYVENEFNRFLEKEKYDNFVFSILHLTDYLHNINMPFLIIGITETWLKDSLHLVDIDGYTFVHHCRIDKRGDGTGLYILKNIQFKYATT